MLVMSQETADTINAFCDDWNNKSFDSIDQIQAALEEIIQELKDTGDYVIIAKDPVKESEP
jgi:uncharacterized membrane protein YraQ (UPF0718 family)